MGAVCHSFSNLFILILIFSSVAFMVPQANGQGICQEMLYGSGCTLDDCGKKCFQRHHNLMSGVCLGDHHKHIYACFCIFKCPPQLPHNYSDSESEASPLAGPEAST